MDYSKMSDFEINRAVAIAEGFPPDDCDIAKRGSPLVGVEWNDDTGCATKSFDYCNNPSDAWPIIVNNLIALRPVEKYVGGHRWFATKGDGDFGIKYADDNPLRAAMCLFLMIHD